MGTSILLVTHDLAQAARMGKGRFHVRTGGAVAPGFARMGVQIGDHAEQQAFARTGFAGDGDAGAGLGRRG